MGIKIPRLKFDGFCCAGISEIKSLFSGTLQVWNIRNNDFEVKSAPPAQICSEHSMKLSFHLQTCFDIRGYLKN